jgi:dihydroorotase
VNPPLRTEKDRLALILGLRDDVIDVIATDHAPHAASEKRVGIVDAPFGISGFETAFGSLMRLVHAGKIPLSKLISKLTQEPARVLAGRHDTQGTLTVGSLADITVLDPDREWVVDTGQFASKGKNTPLAGAVLKGKVMATIVAGEVVYRDSSVKLEEGTKA